MRGGCYTAENEIKRLLNSWITAQCFLFKPPTELYSAESNKRIFVKTLANTQPNASNYTGGIYSIGRDYRASLR